MEHRWGKRIAVDFAVRLNAPSVTARVAQLTNVSLSGGFITTQVDVRLLSRLQIVIEGARRAPGEPVMIPAYVARKTDAGIGVEWCEFAPAVVAAIIKKTATRQPVSNQRPVQPVPAQQAAGSTARQRKQSRRR